MDNEVIAGIARVYEDLREAKRRKAELAKQFKEELENDGRFDETNADLAEARERMKMLKAEVLSACELEDDMEDAKTEVKEYKKILDQLIAEAISKGVMQNGEEVQLGNRVITPHVSVRVESKQMAMNL